MCIRDRTLSAGAGWVDATCSNISGCVTIEFAPNGDNNKGAGWKFDVSCVARDAGISVADVILPKTQLTTCDEVVSIEIPAPGFDGCASAPEAYIVELLNNGISLGAFSQADFPVTVNDVPAGNHWVEYILFYEDCGGNRMEKDRDGGSYTVADATDLVGNDNINVSLGVDCWAVITADDLLEGCLLYTSPSPRDATLSRMPSSA